MWCVLAELSLGRVASLTSGEGESCEGRGAMAERERAPPRLGSHPRKREGFMWCVG